MPTADTGSSEELVRFALAGPGRRLMSALLDLMAVASVLEILSVVGLFGTSFDQGLPIGLVRFARAVNSGDLLLPTGIAAVLAATGSTVVHAATGRSLGKWITGSMLIVRRTGARPSTARAVVRALVGLVAGLSGGAGYLWTLLDPESRAIHDVVCGTAVVRARKVPHSASKAASAPEQRRSGNLRTGPR